MNETQYKSTDALLRDYFGTSIQARSFSAWIEHLAEVLGGSRRPWLSGHHNLHSVYRARRDSQTSAFYQRCDDCYIDGVPVCWILRWLDGGSPQRFSLMDDFPTLLDEAEQRHWSIFYLGSAASVVAAARERLAREYPALQITLHDGFSPDAPELTASINTLRPDLLLVGMGMPLQERWLLHHLDQLDVGVALQAGGTLDYFTGAQAQPPRWLSNNGLAWLFRLLHNPQRLWRRYLWEPWSLLLPTLRLKWQLQQRRKGR